MERYVRECSKALVSSGGGHMLAPHKTLQGKLVLSIALYIDIFL